MIDTCYVGRLVPSSTRTRPAATSNTLLPPPTPGSASLLMPPPLATKALPLQPPRTDFYESRTGVSWTVYAKAITMDDVSTSVTETTLQVDGGTAPEGITMC